MNLLYLHNLIFLLPHYTIMPLPSRVTAISPTVCLFHKCLFLMFNWFMDWSLSLLYYYYLQRVCTAVKTLFLLPPWKHYPFLHLWLLIFCHIQSAISHSCSAPVASSNVVMQSYSEGLILISGPSYVMMFEKKIRLMRERPQAEWNEDANAQSSFIHCVLVYSCSQQILENSAFPEDILLLAPLLQLPRICIFALWCLFNSVKCVLGRRTSAWPTQCSCNLGSCFS